MEKNAEEDPSKKEEEKEQQQQQNKNAERGDESQKPKDDLKRKQTDHYDDPRLKLMDKEWFKDKKCAVLGCNTGKLTIQIAQEFGCRTILGIDNNAELIKEAYTNLGEAVETKSSAKKIRTEDSSSDEEIPVEMRARGDGSPSSAFIERNLSDVVSFKEMRFNRITPRFAQKYNTIVCKNESILNNLQCSLSETYWKDLDLKAGDIVPAIQTISYNLRQSGGQFVLEPKSLKPYGSEFYNAEEETRAMGLDPKEIVRDKQFIRIFNPQFWRRFVDGDYTYTSLEQINFEGQCIVVFWRYPTISD
ncbi:hypothetical protein RIF29_06521 [Crotalaria pallida]|uniref:RNA methyltransferase n=1 Tax=Crotalaria pallida TaxID=3830 RepID=A0AAN9J3A6_CROPI